VFSRTAASLAVAFGALGVAPAAPALAQSRVIEAPDYVPRGERRVVIERRYYDDEAPRYVRPMESRRNLGGGFIEEIFGDDDAPSYRVRRVPTQREREAETRRGRMALDGGYDRYGERRAVRAPTYQRYDYLDDDFNDPYAEDNPRYVAPRQRLAGPPSAAGAGSAVRRSVDPKFARTTVPFNGPEPAGSILIDTKSRYLYLVQADGTAIRYGVGVGKEGFGWRGTETISQKKEWPDWRPPAEMRQRRPELPVFMAGGPNNPLGARALYLGSTLYRIHGSNEPWTIGHAVSSGCIRMTNEDVTDLYDRVGVGTTVKVI